MSLTKKVEALKAEVAELEKENTRLEGECAKLEGRNDELSSELNSAEEEVEKLKDQLLEFYGNEEVIHTAKELIEHVERHFPGGKIPKTKDRDFGIFFERLHNEVRKAR